jgi:hypothetical protein
MIKTGSTAHQHQRDFFAAPDNLVIEFSARTIERGAVLNMRRLTNNSEHEYE